MTWHAITLVLSFNFVKNLRKWCYKSSELSTIVQMTCIHVPSSICLYRKSRFTGAALSSVHKSHKQPKGKWLSSVCLTVLYSLPATVSDVQSSTSFGLLFTNRSLYNHNIVLNTDATQVQRIISWDSSASDRPAGAALTIANIRSWVASMTGPYLDLWGLTHNYCMGP